MLFKYISSHFFVACLFAIVTVGCRNTGSQISISGDLNPPAETVVLTRPLQVPLDSSVEYFAGLRKKPAVLNYYRQFGTDPVWTKGGKRTFRGDSIMIFIRNAPRYGLNPERYHSGELSQLEASASGDSAIIRTELLLTDAFLCIASDLRYGILSSNRSFGADSLQIDLLHTTVLHGGVRKRLESQEPEFAGYKALKTGLALILDSLKAHPHDSIRLVQQVHVVTINLERWRSETADLNERHIFINIPSYMLEVSDHNSVLLTSRVIVGTPDHETPIVSSVVECFTIYPYWHVPRKIAVEEFLPIIKSDTAFITRSNFDVLDRNGDLLNPDSIPWHKFSKNYFPVTLRQREGPENSLGIIKFMFDNPYAVYLHDTNARKLFKNKQRAFSHGCIRMERAVDLAHYLVTEKVGAESKTVALYLREKQQRWVDLKNPIPIYTRYLTCEFKDGALQMYSDIYKKDQALYERMCCED